MEGNSIVESYDKLMNDIVSMKDQKALMRGVVKKFKRHRSNTTWEKAKDLVNYTNPVMQAIGAIKSILR
jgi:hypothetical protein